MNPINSIMGSLSGVSGTMNGMASPESNLDATSGNTNGFMGDVTKAQENYMDFQGELTEKTLEMSMANQTAGAAMKSASDAKGAVDKFQ